MRLSVIVPVGKDDQKKPVREWNEFISQLAHLPKGSEIVFSSTGAKPADLESPPGVDLRWIKSSRGRAKQMNLAARDAVNPYLWFLHADSRLAFGAVACLTHEIKRFPKALLYFRLSFGEKGMTALNAWGANFRSHYLKMPFGDQGFCISKANFERLGGYREDASYGEDHLFVWAARRAGLEIEQVPSILTTSPRKYQRNGWLATTASHLLLTVRQAVPEAARMLRKKK